MGTAMQKLPSVRGNFSPLTRCLIYSETLYFLPDLPPTGRSGLYSGNSVCLFVSMCVPCERPNQKSLVNRLNKKCLTDAIKATTTKIQEWSTPGKWSCFLCQNSMTERLNQKSSVNELYLKFLTDPGNVTTTKPTRSKWSQVPRQNSTTERPNHKSLVNGLHLQKLPQVNKWSC